MIKAIETVYKGYKFRSRLEARWAVFFNTLGIDWRYEEQGYENEQGRYLPDFRLYLPKIDLWRNEAVSTDLFVEVKGNSVELSENWQYWDSLHDFGGILPGFSGSLNSNKEGLILLGEIPLPGNGLTHFHPIIQHDKGLHRNWFMFHHAPEYGNIISLVGEDAIADLLGVESEYAGDEKSWIVKTKSISLPAYYPAVDRAYQAARSARFEHGESG